MPAWHIGTPCIAGSGLKPLRRSPRRQNHHESNLPSQRYRETRKLPPSRNPIVPTNLSASMMPPDGHIDGYTRALDEVNARSRQPLPTSNPIFGYSVHRPPPVMPTGSDVTHLYDELNARADTPVSQASGGSTSSKARMAELQRKIDEEREKRKQLETLLATES